MLALSAPFINSENDSNDTIDLTSTSEKNMSLIISNDDNDVSMDDSAIFVKEIKSTCGK